MIGKLGRKFKQQGKFKQTFFTTQPIKEGVHKVTPPLQVPPQIIKPAYINDSNPVFGIYEGKAVKHDKKLIDNLRIAGQLAANCLHHTANSVKEGMTTDDIDHIAHKYIIEHDAYPTAIGFMNFPKSICTSVNEVCCHGIPDFRPLVNGDYVNLDCTLFINGVHGDTSKMVLIGDVHPEVVKLIEVTQQALYESIRICGPGVPFKRIGQICEEMSQQNGYKVCELFTGHGIGELLHLPPMVCHHYNENFDEIMQPGMVFTIEPIIMMRDGKYIMWKDNFTIISPNNPSAQWEHTILITETGYEVLSIRPDEVI